MMTIMVKPAPGMPLSTASRIVHPASGNLLDANGAIPAGGKPWAYDGLTCRLLTDGTIFEADDPIFAAAAPAEAAPAPVTGAVMSGEQADAVTPAQPAAAAS